MVIAALLDTTKETACFAFSSGVSALIISKS
ncbi:MAG: hypothetical protein DDT23_00399 [candidate division WS2 bacterium]|nr:hypothetical protein [Candidatus Lithacetigena glycinireducens]